MFWKSLSPVEKEHTIRAFTFELGKCYEQAIKERELRVLANVDSELCAEVAAGLGLPAPKATEPAQDMPASAALSQLGETWPPDGRMIGIVVDPGQLNGVRQVREAILAAGMVPLLIAPHGGELDGGLPAQRSYLTARSVEFDALLLAASPPPAPDALPSRDAKGAVSSTVDPRILLMIQESYRHSKAIGAWGNASLAIEAAGCTPDDPGIILGDNPTDVLKQVIELIATHRVWHRFPTSVKV
jgi:catalase